MLNFPDFRALEKTYPEVKCTTLIHDHLPEAIDEAPQKRPSDSAEADVGIVLSSFFHSSPNRCRFRLIHRAIVEGPGMLEDCFSSGC